MREQLKQLMQEEGFTAARLANSLKVQPSAISHILNGRNKPGFEIIVGILGLFPMINADWLLTGKGKMYRRVNVDIESQESTSVYQSDNLINELFKSSPAATKPGQVAAKDRDRIVDINEEKVTNVNYIEKIVIFYSNKRFIEYRPDS